MGATALEWWFTQAKILFLYLKLAVWPWPLVIHYEFPYLKTVAEAWPWLLMTGLLAIGALVLLWRRSAVGFVAEVVFHVLPLTLVLLALSPLRRWIVRDRLVWTSVVLVAVAEPTFQVLFKGNALAWGDLYTWLHVFAIALLQLYVFRRYDFVSMYTFRLIYYAYWHIVWGVLRLSLLF